MNLYVVKNRGDDSADYLLELMRLWGLCCGQSLDWGEIPADADVVIIPSKSDISADKISRFLSAGSHVIAIMPSVEQLNKVGIDCGQECDSANLCWLRLRMPLLDDFSHYALPVHSCWSEVSMNEQSSGNSVVWAWINDPVTLADVPGILTLKLSNGHLTIICYDLVECVRNLRQGRPSEADGWQPREDNFRGSFLFGSQWPSQFESSHLPLADLHAMVFVRLIEQYSPMPLPRLWQLPGRSRSAILISGDEDGSSPSDDQQMLSFLESIDASMTLYIIASITKCTCNELNSWRSKGHGFSAHPFPTRDLSRFSGSKEDTLCALKQSVLAFKEQFDLPVYSVRNHRIFWAGYMDIPKLWQEIGVEMDCNFGYNLTTGRMSGFFATPAASLPLSFLDENFKRINVLQQPCHIGDDVALHPDLNCSLKLSADMFEKYAEVLIKETLEPLGVPFAVCFHPANFTTYASDAERRFLLKAKSNGAALMSDHQWLNFWKMRNSWQMTDARNSSEGYRFEFAGKIESNKLSISLPVVSSSMRVCVNGDEARISKIEHFGQNRVLVRLPDNQIKCGIEIYL